MTQSDLALLHVSDDPQEAVELVCGFSDAE